MTWPTSPRGDMAPILELSIEMLRKEAPPVVLTKNDRCDRCGAAANYRLGGGVNVGDLDLCTHHFRRHYPKMAEQGWFIIFANPEAKDV